MWVQTHVCVAELRRWRASASHTLLVIVGISIIEIEIIRILLRKLIVPVKMVCHFQNKFQI